MKRLIFLYMLLFSIISCKKEDEPIVNDNPLVHFTFDGNFTNLEDPGNNGKQFVGVTFVEDRNGNPKSACYFDGIDDRINFKNPLRKSAEAFTISAWFKVGEDFYNHFNGNLVVVLRDETVTNVLITKVDSITSTLCFDNYFESDWLMTCSKIPTTDWFHMVGVYKKNAATKLFVNGVLINKNTTIPPIKVSYDFRLDSYLGAVIREGVSDEPNTFWNGEIDDFRLYEKALSEAEVLELYNGQSENVNP